MRAEDRICQKIPRILFSKKDIWNQRNAHLNSKQSGSANTRSRHAVDRSKKSQSALKVVILTITAAICSGLQWHWLACLGCTCLCPFWILTIKRICHGEHNVSSQVYTSFLSGLYISPVVTYADPKSINKFLVNIQVFVPAKVLLSPWCYNDPYALIEIKNRITGFDGSYGLIQETICFRPFRWYLIEVKT